MNVFEFNTYDLDEKEREFYRPFRYEIPKVGLSTIEEYITFCKNVAVLLSFSEETFQNGVAEYLDTVGYGNDFDDDYEEGIDDDEIYTPETGVTKEQMEGLAEKIVKMIPVKDDCTNVFCDENCECHKDV